MSVGLSCLCVFIMLSVCLSVNIFFKFYSYPSGYKWIFTKFCSLMAQKDYSVESSDFTTPGGIRVTGWYGGALAGAAAPVYGQLWRLS